MEELKQPRNIMTSGNDPYDHTLKGKLNGLFYYYWEPALGDNNAQILTGTTDAISNITYVPFFDIKDSDLLSIPFDNKRYGGASGYRVYRIVSPRPQEEIDLMTLPLYNIELPKLGTLRNFKFESKLQDYPYRTKNIVARILLKFGSAIKEIKTFGFNFLHNFLNPFILV